jgi:hypothetical protein
VGNLPLVLSAEARFFSGKYFRLVRQKTPQELRVFPADLFLSFADLAVHVEKLSIINSQ